MVWLLVEVVWCNVPEEAASQLSEVNAKCCTVEARVIYAILLRRNAL